MKKKLDVSQSNMRSTLNGIKVWITKTLTENAQAFPNYSVWRWTICSSSLVMLITLFGMAIIIRLSHSAVRINEQQTNIAMFVALTILTLTYLTVVGFLVRRIVAENTLRRAVRTIRNSCNTLANLNKEIMQLLEDTEKQIQLNDDVVIGHVNTYLTTMTALNGAKNTLDYRSPVMLGDMYGQ